MDNNHIVILDRVPVTEFAKTSLKIRKGRQILIKGQPRTGKSTLLKIIVGLVEPDVGTVILFGKKMTRLPQSDLMTLRRKVAYLGYPMGLIENWTVYQNISLPLKYHWQMRDKECDARIMELEQYLGSIQDFLRYQVAQLSDEIQKQITVFRGLAMHPELLLLDLDEMQLTQSGFIGNLVHYIFDRKVTALMTDSSKQHIEGSGKFEIRILDKTGEWS